MIWMKSSCFCESVITGWSLVWMSNKQWHAGWNMKNESIWAVCTGESEEGGFWYTKVLKEWVEMCLR